MEIILNLKHKSQEGKQIGEALVANIPLLMLVALQANLPQRIVLNQDVVVLGEDELIQHPPGLRKRPEVQLQQEKRAITFFHRLPVL